MCLLALAAFPRFGGMFGSPSPRPATPTPPSAVGGEGGEQHAEVERYVERTLPRVQRGGAALVVGRNGARSQPSSRAGRPGRAPPGSPPGRPCPPPASPPWQRSSARGPAAAKAAGLADVAHGQNDLLWCRQQLLGRGGHGEVAPRRAPPAPPTAGWGAAEGGVGRGWAAAGGGGDGCVRKLARAGPV